MYSFFYYASFSILWTLFYESVPRSVSFVCNCESNKVTGYWLRVRAGFRVRVKFRVRAEFRVKVGLRVWGGLGLG